MTREMMSPPTPPTPVEPFDVDDVLVKLSIAEKIDLLSGVDFWHTKSIPRLGIPAIRFSDGPNGVRGTRFFNGVPAACFPCGTALGATWNTPLLQRAGTLMGEEAIVKGTHVLLGPTVNMHRSPLGGRGFESFSEDPVLAGNCAAAVVGGIQSKDVVATIKHFVANDQEHQRMAVDSLVTERALREIYLLPFQIAVRDARPGAFMTSYNKVNGTHVSENPRIIRDVLREEWGWDGMVMSDWYGTYSTSEAINAGLDLEMPGPTRWRGKLITHALMSNKITPRILDQRVREVLKLVSRVKRTNIPERAPEGSRDVPETAKLLREIAAESIVLLKNDRKVLPLSKTKTVAVIGPNAKIATFCGGGSAALIPYYAVTPFDGISAKVRDTRYSIGCYSHQLLPLLGPNLRTADGKIGVTFKAFTAPIQIIDRQPVDVIHLNNTYMYLADYYHPKLTEDLYWAEVEGYYTPDEDGEYEFGLTVYGTAKLYIDDKLLVDNETVQRSGGTFFNVGTVEEIGVRTLKAGVPYKLKVEYASGVTSKLADADGVVTFGGGGIRLGGARIIDPKEEIRKAVDLAKSVDQVILCVGLNQDWEQEGLDREHMDLPGHTDELISAVATANPNAVVVLQSGTPVTMPWAHQVSTLVQAWYGGNETGNAIADVLFGDVNPSGKLPLSFPVRNEDNPAFLNYRSERGRVLYGEDVYVGYRYYEATGKRVQFPFGHGLSYTSFRLDDLSVEVSDSDSSFSSTPPPSTLTSNSASISTAASPPTSLLKILLRIHNTGALAGAEVIQVYVHPHSPSIRRPVKELKAFRKEFLLPGESRVVEIVTELKYATAFWDEGRGAWVCEKGGYDVLVGASSAYAGQVGDGGLKGSFQLAERRWWNGL